ncbi:MAG TPA: hypothetical protein VGD26_10775 [Chitinophagaceae bacterium]
MDSTFTNIDEAIELATTLIPNSTTFDKAIGKQWGYLGLRDIGVGPHWFEDCVLYPNSNLSIRKPDDMWKPIDIALLDSSGQELRYSYRGLGRRMHTSGIISLDSGEYAPGAHAPIDLSEDAHFFHLGSNGSDVYCAKVKYWKLPIDTYGQPMVPEHQVLAIALFIRWMWSLANSDKQDRQLSRMDYLSARSEARALGKMPSGIEMDQVAKEWVNLMNTPQFKKF